MSETEKQNKQEIDLKEIRKKLEARIEDALPEEFKHRHDQPPVVESIELENMREVDEAMAKRIVEALLFSSSKPVTINEIKKVIRGYTPAKIEKLIKGLQEEYERENRSFRIQAVANGYELATELHYYQWLKKLDLQKKGKSASFAALETLAVLAYKQPVTRGEIEELRGVDVSGTIATLLERNFIKIVGRKEVPGRPLLYATTDLFLQHFGLRNLSDLPRVHEIKEIVEAAIERDNLIEKEKFDAHQKDKERKKELEKEEVEELTRQRDEIKQKYEEIAGEVEGIKTLKPKELSEIVNPSSTEEGPVEESSVEAPSVQESSVADNDVSEGEEKNLEASEETPQDTIKEHETRIIKPETEDTNEPG